MPHITLRDIANNAEIDVIYEGFHEKLEPLRMELNAALGRAYAEWEVPRESGDPWPESAASAWLITRGPGNTDAEIATALRVLNTELGRNYTLDDVPDQPRDPWEPGATDLHRRWWEQRIARQKKIDASIAANADYEYLYDKPYEDRGKVRVAGPFTVESISPHRVLGVDENGNIIDGVAEPKAGYGSGYDFGQVILENLKTSGVQQAHREDRIEFTSITPWPGRLVCAEGVYVEGDDEDGIGRRAAIFIGPEFGTVSRPDLVEAAREAADGGFDVLIACAFNYEAHTTEFESLGPRPGAEGADERRPPHGRRPEEHRQGQSVRDIRRAGHRHSRRRRRADTGQGQRRGRVPSQHRGGAQRRAGWHRLLVHRHRLQRGGVLRPPRLLPGSQATRTSR